MNRSPRILRVLPLVGLVVCGSHGELDAKEGESPWLPLFKRTKTEWRHYDFQVEGKPSKGRAKGIVFSERYMVIAASDYLHVHDGKKARVIQLKLSELILDGDWLWGAEWLGDVVRVDLRSLKWKRFKNPRPGDGSLALAFDGRYVWYGGESTGLQRLDPKKERWERFTRGRGPRDIDSILVQDKILWPGTWSGLFQLRPDTKQVVPVQVGGRRVHQTWIHDMASDGKTLWIGTRHSGAYGLTKAQTETSHSISKDRIGKYVCQVVSSSGHVVFGVEFATDLLTKVFVHHKKSGRLEEIQLPEELSRPNRIAVVGQRWLVLLGPSSVWLKGLAEK